MMPDSTAPGAMDGDARSRLQKAGRIEYRMLTDGQEITPEQRQAVLAEFADWWGTQTIGDKRIPLRQVAQRVGIKQSTLSELLRGTYRGNADTHLRLLDTHLAEERSRLGLRDLGAFARIGLTSEVFGAVQLTITLRSLGAIIAEPGTCKTSHAVAFCQQRPQTYLVRVESEPADRMRVSELLCRTLHDHRGSRELQQYDDQPHSRRMRAIRDFLDARQNAVIIVDEAQKLSANGMELLRDLHDPSGARQLATPMVFFGDERFKRLIGETRDGKRTKMTSQFASRLYPVLDVREQITAAGGDLYTLEDVIAITRNQRLKTLSPAAARWLTVLANVAGYGRMRTASYVFKGALQLYADLVAKRHPLGVEHLQEAFVYVMTRRLAEEIDATTGGELLRKVG